MARPPVTPGRNSALNRGALQEVLLDAFVERVGPDHLHLGHRLEEIDADDRRATVVFATEHDDNPVAVGAGVVAADGIHSTVRSRHYPSEGRPQWNGSLLWRGVAEVEPLFGRAHDGLGRSSQPEVRCLSDR